MSEHAIELPSLEVIRAARAIASGKLATYYPASGPLSRDKYPKHLEFFRASRDFTEVAALGGNRSGKSDAGSFATTLHLTGEYPPWWEGRRWDRPVKAWASGNTSKTVRDIIQEKLLGSPVAPGSGFIPAHRIAYTTNRVGVPEAIETAWVKHKSGGTSELQFKSYDARREAFEGTAQDLIWCDEEPPMDIYTECLLRLLTTKGLIMLTYTPLQGLTELTSAFLAESPAGSI